MQIRDIVKSELLNFAVKSGRVILLADDCDEFAKLAEEKFKSTNSDYAAARRALGEYCHKDKAVLGTNIVNFDKWLKTRLNLDEPDCA
jgi:hypothetical protein